MTSLTWPVPLQALPMKKLSYASGTSTEPLMRSTIGDAFDQTVARFPNHEAIVVRHQAIRLTYAELQEQVNQCARALLAIEVQKGDRVGIWAPNCLEWLVLQIATAKIGAILVNINPSYRLHELEYALKQSGCNVLVAAAGHKYANYLEMIYDLAPELMNGGKMAKLPELRQVIGLIDHPLPGILPWFGFLIMGSSIPDEELQAVQSSLTADEPINIQYTSGTTGYPKGATLSHYNILNNGLLTARNMRFSDQDRLVIPVPLYHCFGMVLGNLACITHGATMIYPSAGFEPEEVLRAVEEEKATALHGVPTMFIAELDHPNFDQYDLSSLRTGIMAGALCPSKLMEEVNSLMHMQEVEIAYGMTETSPVSTQTRYDAPFDKRVSTVGTVLPHTEIKIVDPDSGEVVPIGEPGELCTRGYCVMLGYWSDPEQTAEAIDVDGWMHSGDLATLDEDGYVNIVGRIKDMIIRGGENIYPKEIEEFFYKHPKVSEVQVIGIPDEKYGEEVCAWIQLMEGETATEEEMKAYCEGQITHFKIPRHILFVEEFPMTVTGKIRKVEMREKTVAMLQES